MTPLLATVFLLVALPCVVWPVLRPRPERGADAASGTAGVSPADSLAVEEVELDEFAGRISAAEASARIAEIRSTDSRPG